MSKVNAKLLSYIVQNIFPEYAKNEKAHNLDHINQVIERSFKIMEQNNLDLDNNMVFTIAAYHDIAHHIDSKNHEKLSAEYLLNDSNLKEFFTDEQIKIMSEAVYDHRASMEGDPRSTYGKLVSSADRNNTVNQCLKRSYYYGKKLDPNATDEELFKRAYGVLKSKFGEGGYAKFYFKDEEYENFLKEIRELLQDEEKFCKAQKEYIAKLEERECKIK